jgi:tetratricopeptide (TPR) repeat protein
MATYNKRGYKSPKPEVEKDPAFDTSVDEINVNENESTTAGVFNTLDETANKTEEWVIRNQKAILGFIGAVAIATLGYILYDKYVATPSQEEAFKEMNQAQMYFQQAVDATEKQDSLFKLSLKGGEGKLGFEGIISEYPGTKAANLAEYSAGMACLHLKDFKKAIEHLDNFSTKELNLHALAIGAKGDANAELNNNEEALKLYVEAANVDENDFVTPRFLLKAANMAIVLKRNDEALGYLKTIKEKYETSQEGSTVDILIASLEK